MNVRKDQLRLTIPDDPERFGAIKRLSANLESVLLPSYHRSQPFQNEWFIINQQNIPHAIRPQFIIFESAFI
ncbi:hypothetical protein D3C77_423240 [compost metagenome]